MVVIERRVFGLGVSAASVSSSGSDRLVVQLPGVQDPRRAAEVLGTTARLEFRAQKPETQQELSNLTRLKRLIVARQEQLAGRNQASDGEQAPDVSGPLTDLLKQQGIEVPANASEEEQLEALLIETERRITPLFGEPELTGSDLVDAGRQQQQGSQSWEVTLALARLEARSLLTSPRASPAPTACSESCWTGAPSVKPVLARSSLRPASPVALPPSPVVSLLMKRVI